MEIIYQDNRVLVCVKPVGVLSTDEPGGLPELIRAELGDEQACVRTVHRLDQVVGGVMVLARSREAARRLSAQMAERRFSKAYLAVVHGEIGAEEGMFRDLLARSRAERRTYIVKEPGKDVREAVLRYQVLERRGELSLVQVELETGRTHQIRAQFSGHGFPLAGDRKYGAPEEDMAGIALWSNRLEFDHPQTGERMAFASFPPMTGAWAEFSEILNREAEKVVDKGRKL